MKINILKHIKAIPYQPQVPTYAIRIFDPDPGTLIMDLRGDYQVIKEYMFHDTDIDFILSNRPDHDVEASERKYHLFNSKIARNIIQDFSNNKEGCLELMVHCTLGGNRSPAVAMALNDIFNLSYDTEKMKQHYLCHNRFIYRLMMEESKIMNL